MKKSFLFLPLLFSLVACTHSTITPFHNSKKEHLIQYPPTDPQSLGIFRKMNPFPKFLELGLISLETKAFDLPSIYAQLRKDAAEAGAEAIIDVRFHSETHTETNTTQKCNSHTDCNSEGVCSTTQDCHPEVETQEVTTYLTEGSMIRRKP